MVPSIVRAHHQNGGDDIHLLMINGVAVDDGAGTTTTLPSTNDSRRSTVTAAIPCAILPAVGGKSSSSSSFVTRACTFLPWALFALQLFAILQNHSHVGGLSMYDTILLLIIGSDSSAFPVFQWLFHADDDQLSSRQFSSDTGKISLSTTTTTRPLLLVIGALVFEAFLFVNFTHSLEAIFCADSSSHFSTLFIAMIALNVLCKFGMLALLPDQFAIDGIPMANRVFLHLGASLITLALYAANFYFTPNDDYLISLLDRYFGAGLCLLLSLIVFPIFRETLPFLLCDVPDGIDAQQLKFEIEQKFPAVLCCNHFHIYREWPDRKQFTAILHVLLKIMGANEMKETIEGIRAFIKQKGAHNVWIQPTLHQSENASDEWRRQRRCNILCVSEQCQMAKKSCCSDGDGMQ